MKKRGLTLTAALTLTLGGFGYESAIASISFSGKYIAKMFSKMFLVSECILKSIFWESYVSRKCIP